MGRRLLLTTEIEDILTHMIQGRKGRVKKVRAREAYNYLTTRVKRGQLQPPLPSVSRISKAITEITEKLKNVTVSELDQPWNIGACMKYNIPLTHELFDFYGTRPFDEEWNNVTVRKSKWFAFLYPLLEQKLEKVGIRSDKKRDTIAIIASQYARIEQIAEIHEHPINTSWLDNGYFVKEDFEPLYKVWDLVEGDCTLEEAETIKMEIGWL